MPMSIYILGDKMKTNVKKLQKKYKEEKNPDIRERILMVMDYKRGQSSREVAKRFGCTHGKVLYWKDRFEQEGLEGLKTRSRPGHPKKLSDKALKEIKEKLEKNEYGWRSQDVRKMIYEDYGVKYCIRHVIRLLHKWDFRSIRPRKKHINTATEEEKEKFKKNPKNTGFLAKKLDSSMRRRVNSKIR